MRAMEQALVRLSGRFPKAGLVLQLGDKFYEHRNGELREVPWVCTTPPPVVTRMSAVNLPSHGEFFKEYMCHALSSQVCKYHS